LVNNEKTTNFPLHDEQTVKELRKITWASVFGLERRHIYLYIVPFLYIYEGLPFPFPFAAETGSGHFPYISTYTDILKRQYIYVYTSIYIYTENRTDGKRQLPFVCCERKMKTANFRLFAA
jgi:hypothetical protein